MSRAEVLLLGGRSGVGKTTIGWEVAAQLRAAGIGHAVIEGDFMGQVFPAPDGDRDGTQLVERNLAAVWANYARLGYHRLIYTNTLSVLPRTAGMFRRAMGADVRIIGVLLTASDDTVGQRLARRELGTELAQGLRVSSARARLLDEQVPMHTLRIATDHRGVIDIAREIVAVTGWLDGGAEATGWPTCAE